MAEVLALPFRLLNNGDLATVEQGTDEANGQEIAITMLTGLGEHPLVGSFGVTDPAFQGLEPTELLASVALHGPPIDIDRIDLSIADEHAQLVTVTFADAVA